jgi:glycosyltransferase involved in cell wall biosynthesis
MRVLTFNWHEAYICLLAKTGHQFDVVERLKGGSLAWFYETRPLPPNVRIVKETTARHMLRQRRYDAVVCHTVRDAVWAREWPAPKILVLHNQLTTEIALGGHTVDPAEHRAELESLVAGVPDLQLVFISERKQRDWALPGRVIPPGIDLTDYDGYEGDTAAVLRVGNFMRRRDLMLGFTAQQEILAGLPSTLLGLNEPDDGGRFTTSWDDLKDCFRSHRAYLNTTVEGYEDGYNLSMLEAMATGMPVVATANATSPIRDGENGYVSADLAYLSTCLRRLLDDKKLATQLGQAARETVSRQFPLERFVNNWNAALDACRSDSRPGASAPVACRSQRAVGRADHDRRDHDDDEASRLKILLAYVSYPATTGRYLETSLRRRHEVLTVGPAIGAELIRAWKLEAMREPVTPHDIPCDLEPNLDQLVGKLSSTWRPDLFLWVESVQGYCPEQIPRLDCPTACYLIDSHLNLERHLSWAQRFDWVFVAQRAYIPAFREAGCRRVRWLPLGCDPAVHGKARVPKQHDIGFVGSLTAHNARRKRLLERLERRFQVHVERSFLRDMARTLSACRLVFNEAIKSDLNMRVFEALASGSMLLTDRAEGSGLAELFEDRRHLVIYDESDLETLAAYYLEHEPEREAIAAAGRQEVLRRHTYDHRALTIVETVLGEGGDVADEAPDESVEDPVLADGIRLASERRFPEALTRLELAGVQRELSARERYELHKTAARCLRAVQSDVEAATRARALMRQATLLDTSVDQPTPTV